MSALRNYLFLRFNTYFEVRTLNHDREFRYSVFGPEHELQRKNEMTIF